VTLGGITVTDPLVSVTGGPISLAPGAQDATSFTARYSVTQADIDAGEVQNTATVTADLPGGGTVSDTSGSGTGTDEPTVTPLVPTPGIALVKTAVLNDDDGTPGVSAGDSIDYAFRVVNTGAVTLGGITVTDPLVSVTGGPISLAPGAQDATSFTARYSVTQADIDAGEVQNTATVTADLPGGGTVSDTSGSGTGTDEPTVTPLVPTPGIALVKTAVLNDDDGTPGVSAGDSIDYAFRVVNTGAVTLGGITVTDPLVSVTGGPISLAPGAQDATSFTAHYTVTQADIDAGEVQNTATVTADLPGGGTISDTSGSGTGTDEPTVTPLVPTPGIALVKTAVLNDDDGTPGVSAGDSIDYAFRVVNTGAVTLGGITLTDPLVSVTGGPISLAPGAQDATSFTARYIVTQADVLSGHVRNQATTVGHVGSVTASDLSGTATDNDDETVTFLGSIVGRVADAAGPRIQSVVTLVDAATGASVTTVLTGADGSYAFIGLEPGNYCVRFSHESDEGVLATTGTAQGASQQGDEVCGIAIVLGANRLITGVDALMVDPSGVIYDSVTRAPLAGATVTLLINGTPVPDSWLAAAGDRNNVVTGATGQYSFLLQSPATSGTYSLRVSAPGYDASTLLPAQTGPLTPGTGLGLEEVVPFANAPAVGQDTTYYLSFQMSFPNWGDATTLSKGIVHNHVPLDPAGLATQLTLTKTADASGLSSPPQVGDVIRYTITARNAGVLPLTGITLDDPLTPDEALTVQTGITTDGVLDAGETWIWTASVTLDAQSVNRDQISNLATLIATDAWGAPVLVESSPTGNAIFGAGNGTPTIVELDGLIDEIRDELETILEDDLRLTVERLSRSFSGFARDAARRLRESDEECHDDTTLSHQGRLEINGGEVQGDAFLEREQRDCLRREWRIDTVEASVTRADGFGSHSVLTYTHRQERLHGEDELRAWFLGGYVSRARTESGTARGTIDGRGVFGGIYGARRLPEDGMLDYYLAAAMGRHSFNFDFARNVTITAKGNYNYQALFAGASLSRPLTYGRTTITPRLGVDLAFARGAEVSVTASMGPRHETGTFRLDSIGSWQLHAEAEISRDLGRPDIGGLPADQDISLMLRPGIQCIGSFGPDLTTCGLDLAMGLYVTGRDDRSTFAAEVEGAILEDRKSAAVQLSWERRLDGVDGTLQINGGLGANGERTASVGVDISF
uniref:DUF7507 domain-containing protein n=1 Tax=Sagittula sp. S175 TaxID=3415129 RepID=UPI003C7D9284